MLATDRTQSLSEFRKKAAATIDRLNKTGNAEILTVNGEARAILLSPAVYDELAREAELSRDVAAIQRAMKEFDQGKGVKAKTFFAELRSELLAMKAAPEKRRGEVIRMRVNTPSEVRQQIREQVLHIAQDSIDNALAWEDRLSAAIEGLADFHGHAIDHDASARLSYLVHKLVFEGTYLIHYWVDDAAGEVRVVRFRHGARLPRTGEP